MNKLELSYDEDMRLHDSVPLPGRRSLYTYFTRLPVDILSAYPKKGYRWWMGRAARSCRAMELRDYVLHWKLFALDFRQTYSRAYLESLPREDLQLFLRTYLKKVPLWAYEAPLQDALQLLLHPHKKPPLI